MTLSDPTSQLITDLESAALSAGFAVSQFGQIQDWPLLAFTRQGKRQDGQAIYLSAGIHGDEPAGPQAILELLVANEFSSEYTYYLCPVLNPFGLSQGIRENAQGIDLNRDYRDFRSPEIQAHRDWFEQSGIRSLSQCIHLHEDWESRGFYLYELNFHQAASLAPRILQAVSEHMPIETATEIDGRPAQAGIIRPESIPEIEEGHPEAIYFQQKFGGLNYTLETPSALSIRSRVEAHKAAVLAMR